MSFDDFALAEMHVDLFAAFGTDALVQRGAAPALPVRIVVDRGVERMGEYGTVIGRVDQVSFLVSQWQPLQGDVLTWADRLGMHTKAVESLVENDGFVAMAVLHG